MVLKYYFDLMSQPSRAVYMFLKLNNIPFKAVPVAIRKGEHLSEDFKRDITHIQRLPVIHHNEFRLTESVAILRYLSELEEYNVAGHWLGTTPVERARVDEYLSWQQLNIRINCAMYFQHKWFLPLLTGKPPNEKSIDKFKSITKKPLVLPLSDPSDSNFQGNMERALDTMETFWLTQTPGPYLAGDRISIADIMGAVEIEQVTMVHYDYAENRPILAKWMKQVQEELGPTYDEAHKVLRSFIPKYTKYLASQQAEAKL